MDSCLCLCGKRMYSVDSVCAYVCGEYVCVEREFVRCVCVSDCVPR